MPLGVSVCGPHKLRTRVVQNLHLHYYTHAYLYLCAVFQVFSRATITAWAVWAFPKMGWQFAPAPGTVFCEFGTRLFTLLPPLLIQLLLLPPLQSRLLLLLPPASVSISLLSVCVCMCVCVCVHVMCAFISSSSSSIAGSLIRTLASITIHSSRCC